MRNGGERSTVPAKFFIYSRKSVCTDKGESIENQAEMCRQYICSKFDDSFTERDITVYEDEGFSAKNTDRPRFKQMLADIRTQRPDYLVCYRLDRISRNVSDFSALIEELNARGISFICIKEEFDTSKPMGKAMMYIASVFAQLERETIAERVRDNMLMLARTGRWLGGTAPLGYSSERTEEIIIDGRVKTACKLKEVPGELETVQLIFDKFLELHSVSGVSKYLISKDVRSRKGVFFSLPGIKEILQNPAYCTADTDAFLYFKNIGADICFEENDCCGSFGLLAYNKRDYKKKNAPRLPVERWIVAIGKHRGLISGHKWSTVQKIIEENIPTGKKPAKMHNDYSLLSGVIVCDRCGRRMFAKPRSAKEQNSRLYDYICSGKLKGGKKLCSCPNLTGRQTDELVCRSLSEYIRENPHIFERLERIKHRLMNTKKGSPAAAAETSIKKLSDEADNLLFALSQGNLSAAFVQKVNARIAQIDSEIKKLESEKKDFEVKKKRIEDISAQTDIIAEELFDLRKWFVSADGSSVYEKRTILHLLIEKIIWDGENMSIFIGAK